MTPKEFNAATNSAAHASNTADVWKAKGNADALAELTTTMSAKQFKAASNAAAAIDTINAERRGHAASVHSRILVQLSGPSGELIVPTANEEVAHFILLTHADVRLLTGTDVWKEPAKAPANKPAPGNSRCGICMKEYKQGNNKSHKRICQPSKAEVVWVDRDCALESRARIRISGSVMHTSEGVAWKPSSQHSEILATNKIVVLSVRQNADGIDTS
jgi:hypothetical protein